MQEVFENIINKLEEQKEYYKDIRKNTHCRVTETSECDSCRADHCLDARLRCVDDITEIVKQEAEQYNNGWIPVEEELPRDCDNRFYMCIVENHEEDLPMFSQYDEEYGFGFWHDIYDEHTLGFVDSEFKTNEELGYEEVIAWQPLPQPYQPKGE